MNTRRKFLIQGSLATTAMLAIKPLDALARVTPTLERLTAMPHSLVFLHTTNLDPCQDKQTIQYITDIKKSNANLILLKAGKDTPDEAAALRYDASIEGNDLSAITGEYRILSKSNIKIGIISAKPGEPNTIQKVNELSAYLKKKKTVR